MSIKQQETRDPPKDDRLEGKEPASDIAGQAAGDESRGGAEAPKGEGPPPDTAGEDAGPEPGQGPETKIQTLEAELAAVREELSSINDKYLRKLADDVNFRKRMAREKEDGQRFAVASLLGDLIPVLDDFDRAISSAEVAKDYVVLHDGVALIRRQLSSVLEAKYGLVRVTSLGQVFDPNHHEAVAVVQGVPEDGEESVVAEEFLPCYKLHDRILRTAKVRVRMPAPAPAPASQAAQAAQAEPAAPGPTDEAPQGQAGAGNTSN